MNLKAIFFLSVLFSTTSFEQTSSTDSRGWFEFKNAAHQIGFCIYHPSQNHCTDHSDELAKREKTAPDDIDVYYFEMKKEWAKNRLDEWAKRQEQPVGNFLILFDVAQKNALEKSDAETFNLFRGFILIDLTDTIDFIFHKKDLNQSMMSVKSDEKNALMENTLWREFMTGRLGRFSPKIDFKLVGKNAVSDFEKFKEAFSVFQTKK